MNRGTNFRMFDISPLSLSFLLFTGMNLSPESGLVRTKEWPTCTINSQACFRYLYFRCAKLDLDGHLFINYSPSKLPAYASEPSLGHCQYCRTSGMNGYTLGQAR
jgi:hypothetical protein